MAEDDLEYRGSSDSGALARDETVDSFLRAVAGECGTTPCSIDAQLDPAARRWLRPGVLVGDRYRLESAIGAGGMGLVWSATHTITGRRVALKFLKGSSRRSAEARLRFLREARAAAAVHHPHVVEILDVFELHIDSPVIVMELLHGETLAALLGRSPKLDVPQAAGILRAVTSAVAAAHARGIVHRDLKPANIFLTVGRDGAPTVKVLDFGVAKLARDFDAGDLGLATGGGAVLGTPCYMAPEQALGEPDIDHRADVWALGVILYECLAGQRPVHGSNVGQVVRQLSRTGIAPLTQVAPHVPRGLAHLVDRMTAQAREQRPSGLCEVERQLERYARPGAPVVEGAATKAVARGRWWLAWGIVSVIAAGLPFATPRSPISPASKAPAVERAQEPSVRPPTLPEPIESSVEPAQQASEKVTPPPAQPSSRASRALRSRRKAIEPQPKRSVAVAEPVDSGVAPLPFSGGLAEQVPF